VVYQIKIVARHATRTELAAGVLLSRIRERCKGRRVSRKRFQGFNGRVNIPNTYTDSDTIRNSLPYSTW
jgi:hypothetical protein